MSADLIERVAKAICPDGWHETTRPDGSKYFTLVCWDEEQAKGRRLAMAAIAAMPGWQPIKSAPRDGTMILIAFGPDSVSVGCYSRNDDDLHPWKFMDSQAEGLPIFNGARDDIYGPSYWMPLPHAPEVIW